MNHTALAALVFILGGAIAPPAGLCQSPTRVAATVDPRRPIVIRLTNETDRTLDYARAGGQPRSLRPGATGELFLEVGDRPGDTGSISINTPDWTNPLRYDLHLDRDNVLRVNVRPTAADDPHQNRTIYIDERGRVYTF